MHFHSRFLTMSGLFTHFSGIHTLCRGLCKISKYGCNVKFCTNMSPWAASQDLSQHEQRRIKLHEWFQDAQKDYEHTHNYLANKRLVWSSCPNNDHSQNGHASPQTISNSCWQKKSIRKWKAKGKSSFDMSTQQAQWRSCLQSCELMLESLILGPN